MIFERYTDRARRAVVLAQEEARTLKHNYIGTEHLLLGLIQEGEGVAAKALQGLGLSLDAIRAQVVEIIGQGQQQPGGHIPFTPRAKRVTELSLREALMLGHNYIGTEHILLALIREGEGVAAQILVKLGAELTRVRQQVIQLLSGYEPKPWNPPTSVTVVEHKSLPQRMREAAAVLQEAHQRNGTDGDWTAENLLKAADDWERADACDPVGTVRRHRTGATAVLTDAGWIWVAQDGEHSESGPLTSASWPIVYSPEES